MYGIQAAARGHATEKPDWLLDWEEEEAEQLKGDKKAARPDDTDDSSPGSG